ncbi:MAG TPA: sugar transferase, partial [Nitrosospira sp.]|nr:sugar transferase [Nitrosospira sp.]
MEELLYLVHRFPYPPNKGDKIRSYHLLKHLSQSYRIHLGAFIDDEKDLEYVD